MDKICKKKKKKIEKWKLASPKLLGSGITAASVSLAGTTISTGSVISACFAWKAIRVSAL